jgi:hypothetical protein
MTPARQRPTRWWLDTLRRRRERMYDDALDLSTPMVWSSEAEQRAAVAFFNAAFRAEESGLRQAHELSDEVASWDPELAECLRLYGDEEGWHRELLTKFLPWLGGAVKPMGRVTGTFYKLYAKADRMETIVLTNLMFETIGSTTYRLALGRVTHPTIRQMLTILTRDESFHVPLNVHFLRSIRDRDGHRDALRLQMIHDGVFLALLASAYASRRRAADFDRITFKELSRAYADQLARLFAHEPDLRLRPPSIVLRAIGVDPRSIYEGEAIGATSIEAAERAADRENVRVSAM